MSTDTKIKTLIFNKLTQEQYNNADRVPTEFYLTPDTSIDSSEKGAANGVATLGANGKVPTEQIPVATASSLGGVKPDGNTITVTEDGTISSVGGSGSGSGFDFEGTKAEFDAAVAAGTITADSVSLITDDVDGADVATKAELQAVDSSKVAKTGDTMTGTLKMSGQNQIRFGTDDNYYYVQCAGNGQLSIFKNNKGLFLQTEEAHAPFYWNGTNAYRLLTTADLESLQTQINSLNTEVTGMLGRMNYNARVDFNLQDGQSYTVPSKGYLWISGLTAYANGGSIKINGGTLALAPAGVWTFVPVSAGDVLSAVRADDRSNISVSGFFVPQI